MFYKRKVIDGENNAASWFVELKIKSKPKEKQNKTKQINIKNNKHNNIAKSKHEEKQTKLSHFQLNLYSSLSFVHIFKAS